MPREGYLLIDHQASPGMPRELAGRPLDPALGEGKVFEAATLTCAHCKVVVIKNPSRQRERAFCRKCMHYICDFCAAQAYQPDYAHAPFEKIADEVMSCVTASPPGPLLIPPAAP